MVQKISLVLLGTCLSLYLAVGLLLRLGQAKLIFRPDAQLRATPAKYNLDYQDVWLEVEQSRIHGWWIPHHQESAPIILYFHGNASNNGDVVDNAAIFNQLGLSVLLIDYRGYGRSSAIAPNETRAYQDAAAAWQYLTVTRNIDPQRIFVYGHSLGGAVAIDLAIHHPEMAGLIVEGTFTSMWEIADYSLFFRLFPLDIIITQSFNSLDKITSLNTPLLIFHGESDEIIPVFMSQKLFAAAPHPKQLIVIPQAQHNNLHHTQDPRYRNQLQQFIHQNLAASW